MTPGLRRDAIVLGCVVIAGCALLAYVIPVHPAALWNIRCDRQQSVVKAREISTAFGVNTSGWDVKTYGDTEEEWGYFLQHHPTDDAASRFTPVYPKVEFDVPGKADRVVIELSAAGEVNQWEHKGYAKSAATDPGQARRIATLAFLRFVGAASSTFHAVTDVAATKNGLLFAWERPGQVTERFEATVNGSNLVKAQLKPIYNSSLEDAFRSRKHAISLLNTVTVVGPFVAGTVFAAGILVYWAVRRAIRYRFVLGLTTVAVAGAVISWLNFGRYSGQTNITIGDSPAAGWLAECLMLLLAILFYGVLAGASDAVGQGPKLATLRSIFSLSALNRSTGISVLAGLLCGPLFAALPLWISSWHLMGSEQMGDDNAALIYSVHAAVQSLHDFVDPAMLGLFGIGAAFLVRYIRKPKIAYGALLVLGTLMMGSVAAPSETSAAAYLLKGALLSLIYLVLFVRFDLLAVLSASYAVHVLWNASALLLQPARSLHVSGITALSVLGGLTVCAALAAWKGHELTVAETAGEQVRATSQREALMAEFSIAHRVQQHMLPQEAPEIPGCSVAAACHPAREVGGDLFDFLRLPDGRWTVGVGDVSGKGVPASLYMTLTKGLLVATTQDSSDLVDIAANVNGHIHTVAQRKTFVTMALGAFDPETRTLDHVRAGHNPTVWRRPSENATRWLNGPGIGLGLATDKLFRRATELERLQLQQGDMLVFYSDGLTEAMNSENEQFGEQRLASAVEEADDLDAGGARDSILAKVRTFLNGVPAQDDMTLVVLRVN